MSTLPLPAQIARTFVGAPGAVITVNVHDSSGRPGRTRWAVYRPATSGTRGMMNAAFAPEMIDCPVGP